jgi:two-component system, LytTR family, response regulator
MQKIQALIVDDEEFARENLRMLITDFCPDVEVSGMASSAAEARKMAEELMPDLVFLDIMMPGEDGFGFLSSLEGRSFQVIFTTAFREYALRAIRESAVDYLEKPIDIEELIRAVEKAAARIREKKGAGIPEDRLNRILHEIALSNTVEKTVIPTRDGFAVVRNADIIHLEASENYTTLYCAGGKRYVSSKSIKTFEDRLDPAMFIRVHKSHIINFTQHLREFSRAEGHVAVMSDGARIPVARRKLPEFLERLGQIS